MGIAFTKSAIDLGIVITDSEKSLAFYRDTLGLEHTADTPAPGGGTMHRLMCGDTMIKLVKHAENPAATAAPGGLAGASGIRYFTINCSNVAEMVATCEAAGAPVPVKPTEIRPGVTIAMVEDPDGNWVEFVHYAATS